MPRKPHPLGITRDKQRWLIGPAAFVRLTENRFDLLTCCFALPTGEIRCGRQPRDKKRECKSKPSVDA